MYATIIFMSTRVLTNKEAAEVPVPKSHLFNVQHHVICILKWRPEFIMSDWLNSPWRLFVPLAFSYSSEKKQGMQVDDINSGVI